MELPLNTILRGDCVEIMAGFPDKCVDLVFADPPYNLQLAHFLWRPNQTLVDPVDDEWDQFSTPAEYDEFCCRWLEECRRVLKDTGAIWVIGTYHNIYRIGKIMMDLGFWILNDIVWIKNNPMPNFRGVRFTNAHETLIWAKTSKDQRTHTFNHHTMKMLNDEKQMRSDWYLPICTGPERLMVDGQKVHPTQKPEALLYRVISATSRPGDIILDPFFGSGTTGVVAKRLHRNWIGIEREEFYVDLAQKRIDAAHPLAPDRDLYMTPSRKSKPRVPFGKLLEAGFLQPGQRLYSCDRRIEATVAADGSLVANGFRGSIHKLGSLLLGQATCNGWQFWHVERDGELRPIDELRRIYRDSAGDDVVM